jgi:hypothetical protein
MVPPARINDRNIAFAGMVSSVSTSICASVQGLWISAYLDGRLSRMAETKEEVTKEVMLHTQVSSPLVLTASHHLTTRSGANGDTRPATARLYPTSSSMRFRMLI